jgi:hypothetical protein
MKVDNKIKKFFPWALFLAFALIFAVASCSMARAADKPYPFTCQWLRDYLATHSEAEARAKAVELHLPKWIIHKAERCLP